MSLVGLANRSAESLRTGRGGATASATPSEETVPPPPPAVGQALARLVEFLPVETVAGFWLAVPAAALLAGEAAMAKVKTTGLETIAATAANAPKVTHPNCYDWTFFAVLLVLTPVLLLLQFLSQAPRDKNGKLPTRDKWPCWRMGASTFAFIIWAMAVPGNPFLTTPGQLMTAWFAAVILTAILGYLDIIILGPEKS